MSYSSHLAVALLAGGTAAAIAATDLKDLYHPLRVEDAVFVAVNIGGCPSPDGGIRAYDPDGGVMGCWGVYSTVEARPKRDGLPALKCDSRFPASTKEQVDLFKAAIKGYVLPDCARQHGLEVAP